METATVMQLAAALLSMPASPGRPASGWRPPGRTAVPPSLTSPAYFLIMHAAVAVAVVAVAMRADHTQVFLLAALVLLVGVSFFSGDIAMRTLWGVRLFPMAAPIGGSTMILGWLVADSGGRVGTVRRAAEAVACATEDRRRWA